MCVPEYVSRIALWDGGRMKSKRNRATFVCPHCGADVPVGSQACTECGSDEETGWSEGADVWESGIPAGYGDEDDFDYDRFVEQEFPERAPASPGQVLRRWCWRAGIAVLCLALLSYLWLAR
jgi:hypothetical protein